MKTLKTLRVFFIVAGMICIMAADKTIAAAFMAAICFMGAAMTDNLVKGHAKMIANDLYEHES